MTNVFLTGVTGFIGSHLADALNSKGYTVYALVRHNANPVSVPCYIKVITGDLLDIHSLNYAIRLSQPEIVIHTAALTPVRECFNNPFGFTQINFLGTMNMVHASLKNSILNNFIYASTAEIYTPNPGNIIETDEQTGSTPYGISKLAADLYVRMAGNCYGLPYVILRPTNTYGRKTECGYFIEKVITTMLTKDSLLLNGSPEVIRDFMYVDDHVNAYLSIINSSVTNEIFNFSPMLGLTLDKVIEVATQTLNWKGKVNYNSNPRPYDPPSLICDSNKAHKTLNWIPKVTLSEGLMKVADYWRGKL